MQLNECESKEWHQAMLRSCDIYNPEIISLILRMFA